MISLLEVLFHELENEVQLAVLSLDIEEPRREEKRRVRGHAGRREESELDGMVRGGRMVGSHLTILGWLRARRRPISRRAV